MLKYVLKKEYLRGIMLHYFIIKKSVAEKTCTYGGHTLLETTCRDWFKSFKNNDFDVEDKNHSGKSKNLEDEESEALLELMSDDK